MSSGGVVEICAVVLCVWFGQQGPLKETNPGGRARTLPEQRQQRCDSRGCEMELTGRRK